MFPFSPMSSTLGGMFEGTTEKPPKLQFVAFLKQRPGEAASIRLNGAGHKTEATGVEKRLQDLLTTRK